MIRPLNAFLAFPLCLVFIQAPGQNSPAHYLYIEQYKDIAIREMARTGIPASITLAQGILESNAGRSELAVLANNHFGIKCGSGWSGAAYFKKDDDYGPDGYRVESCFRSYPTVEASFIDHSGFLISPLKATRYGFLFRLDPTDYAGWANGLQQAGYATNPAYAAQLAGLIERYELMQYDQLGVMPAGPSALAPPPIVSTTNNVPFTIASGYETAQDIAWRTRVPVGDLLVYNEDLPTGYLLPAGQKVYLAAKRRAFKGPVETHEVQPSESVYDIAQRYGVRLDRLLARNRLEAGEQPAAGELLKLRGWKTNNPPAIQPYSYEGAVYHTVVTGDTLWNIARRYQTNVESLKQLNNLPGDLIRLGMQIRVR